MRNTKYSKILTKEFLQKEYLKNNKSSIQIAKEIGSGDVTIWRYLIKYNIKIRTRSELNKGKNNPGYKEERHINYYCKELECNNKIHYETWKTGQGRCRSCARKHDCIINPGRTKGRKNGMFGKITHSKGAYYKGIYMRSSYEIKFARFLDLSGYKYLYEPKAFDLGNSTYRPDFYIPEWDLYIEIKGWWRDNSKKKFKLFKKQYPDKNIKLLMKPDLENLGILEKSNHKIRRNG